MNDDSQIVEDPLKVVVKAFRKDIVRLVAILLVSIFALIALVYAGIRTDIQMNSENLDEVGSEFIAKLDLISERLVKLETSSAKMLVNSEKIEGNREETIRTNALLANLSETVGRLDGRLQMLPERLLELDELTTEVAKNEEKLEDAFVAATEAVATIDNLSAGLIAACKDAAILRSEKLSSLLTDEEVRQLLVRTLSLIHI